MSRILIADDSDDTRVFLRAALTSRGWTVCGDAANGRQAVLMATQLKPDLIIMDLSMPMLTGLEATREILRALPGQPVILFTLHASPQLAAAATSVGARKVVSKADGLAALIAAIEQIVGISRPSGGNRGDPGGSSGPSLPFIDSPKTAAETHTTLKPGAGSVLPHPQPLVAASASDTGQTSESRTSEPPTSKPPIGEPTIGEPPTGPTSGSGEPSA